jgi:hypothetical protein
MKYFTKEFPKADNSSSLSKRQQEAIHRKFLRNSKAYQKQLSKLEGRVSQAAWNFFYFGFGRWGLHDAHLYPSPPVMGWNFLLTEANRFDTTRKRRKCVS